MICEPMKTFDKARAKSSSSLRQLTEEELLVVSGGEIVVTGQIPSGTYFPLIWGDALSVYYRQFYDGTTFSPPQYGGSGSYQPPSNTDEEGQGEPGELVDTDGDGEFDVIVVTAPAPVTLPDGNIGYWFSEFGTNFLETYKPETCFLGISTDYTCWGGEYAGTYVYDANGSVVNQAPQESVSLEVSVDGVNTSGTYTVTPQSSHTLEQYNSYSRPNGNPR